MEKKRTVLPSCRQHHSAVGLVCIRLSSVSVIKTNERVLNSFIAFKASQRFTNAHTVSPGQVSSEIWVQRFFSFWHVWRFLARKGASWTWCPPESGFNLLQCLALSFWDEGDSEEDVEDARRGEQPEGSSAG